MKSSIFKRFFLSKLFYTAGIIVLILLATAIARAYVQKNKVNTEVESLQREISRLEQGNKELDSLLDYLQTTSFLESEARNKFGLAKDGERAIVVVRSDDDERGIINEVDERVLPPDLSNPSRWLYYFLSKQKMAI